MERLFRWLRGYINVRLYGHQINRFINLCSRNGIHLWNISHDLKHIIRVNFHLRDFYLLKPFLRKTKTKLRIMSRHGFPFWCHRHPYLKWFPVLCLILICAFFYSRTFVWSIEVHGNDKIAEYELLEVLKTQQVTVGCKKNIIDCATLEYEIRNNFVDIGWVSVYMNQTKLCVEVRESLYGQQEEYIYDGKRYDLVANKDAYIHTFVTRFGTAVTEIGTHVNKGDLLIKGTFDIYDDSGAIKQIQNVRAEGFILGDVVYDFVFPITEFEIMGSKLAGNYSEASLYRIGYEKLKECIEILEANEVLILDKRVMLKKNEKNVVFYGKIYAREQIGTNILVEEVLENEFK